MWRAMVLAMAVACDGGATADPLLGFECVQYSRYPDLSGCGIHRPNGMINGVCDGEPPSGDLSPTTFVGVCRPWRPGACGPNPEECDELGGVGAWTARGACVCVPR